VSSQPHAPAGAGEANCDERRLGFSSMNYLFNMLNDLSLVRKSGKPVFLAAFPHQPHLMSLQSVNN
jgi:hypothetical protein